MRAFSSALSASSLAQIAEQPQLRADRLLPVSYVQLHRPREPAHGYVSDSVSAEGPPLRSLIPLTAADPVDGSDIGLRVQSQAVGDALARAADAHRGRHHRPDRRRDARARRRESSPRDDGGRGRRDNLRKCVAASSSALPCCGRRVRAVLLRPSACTQQLTRTVAGNYFDTSLCSGPS